MPAWILKSSIAQGKCELPIMFNTLGQTTTDLLEKISRVKNWQKIKIKFPFSTNIWNLLLNSEGKQDEFHYYQNQERIPGLLKRLMSDIILLWPSEDRSKNLFTVVTCKPLKTNLEFWIFEFCHISTKLLSYVCT